MSNPDTQKKVKIARNNAGIKLSKEQVTASQPPKGANARARPTPKWQNGVTLYKYG